MVTGILLALLPLLADVVHTRDGRKLEGKVLEYESFVDVEVAPLPGKPAPRPVRVLRRDIVKIDLAPNFIHHPEVLPFPFDQIEKADYKYFPANHVILCLPQPPARKIAAVDLRLGKKIWELDLPNRVGDPVVGGRTVHFMQRDKEVDDTKKIKIAGSPFSKDIHRLTVTAVDIDSCQILWKAIFDNNDRKDQLWEYFTSLPPSLHILPDRIAIRSYKIGYPMDSAGNVNKAVSERYLSFVSYDPVEKRILSRADSLEASEAGGYPVFAEDFVVTQAHQGGSRFKLFCVGLKDGKLRWQSDYFTQGRLFDVNEENAFVADANTCFAYAVKNGKKNDKWSVDCSGGSIAGVDPNFAYLYRTKRAPRGILGFDSKKGTEAWRIDMPDTDEFTHLMFIGHRLLFTDKQNAITCYDTLAKKEMWKWNPAGPGFATYPRVMGSALTFYKDGRVTSLEIDTGRKIWDVKQSYQTILQAGDAGIMAKQLKGTDVIRERKTLPGAAFFTPTDTPLRNVLGDDAWSVPAFDKGTLFTLSSGGHLAAVDLKERKTLWTQKVSNQPVAALAPPLVHAKGIAVNVGGETVSFEPDGKTKQYAVKHVAPRPDRHGEMTPLGLLAVSGGGAAMVDPATGQKIWETPLRSVNAHGAAGGNAYILTSQNLQVIDLKTGAVGDSFGVPRNATLVAVAGKRVYAAVGPFALVGPAPEGEATPLFRPKQQDLRITNRGFKGSLVAADGAAFYSHADGEVGRFEGEKSVWTFAAPGYTSVLLAHDGRLWFSSWGSGLYGLNLKTGAVEWKLEGLADAALFTPFLRDGKVAFWSSEGWLIAPE